MCALLHETCLICHECLVTDDSAGSFNAADTGPVPTVLLVVQGGVVAGLGSAGVMFGAVGAASDLMQDFRTGYLTLASAKVSRPLFYVKPACVVMQTVRSACAGHLGT